MCNFKGVCFWESVFVKLVQLDYFCFEWLNRGFHGGDIRYVVVILVREPGETFERDGYEMCASVIVKRGLLIVYIYGVGSANYVFIWITFLGGEGDKWKVEYWRNVSSILDLRRIEVFYNEFVIVIILLVCIVGDEIVNMVLMCGFSFGVKEGKLILPFILAGMVLECPLA